MHQDSPNQRFRVNGDNFLLGVLVALEISDCISLQGFVAMKKCNADCLKSRQSVHSQKIPTPNQRSTRWAITSWLEDRYWHTATRKSSTSIFLDCPALAMFAVQSEIKIQCILFADAC